MTNHDSARFAQLFALLSQTFDKAASDALAQIYFDSLKDFTVEQVAEAVNQAVRSKKWFPKPAELRELIAGNPEDRAANAWAAFLEAAANGGTASVQFADRATAAAMDATFGSWLEACRLLSAGGTDARGKQVGGCSDEMLASYQKSFLRHYGASLNSNRQVELYRAGLSEASMREQGASWAARMPILEQPVLFVGPDKTHTLRLRFDVAQGCLTSEDRRLLDGGWPAVQVMAAQEGRRLKQAQKRPALPPADVEMATPEEVTELKGNIMKIVTRTLVVIAMLALSVPAQELVSADGVEWSYIASSKFEGVKFNVLARRVKGATLEVKFGDRKPVETEHDCKQKLYRFEGDEWAKPKRGSIGESLLKFACKK